MDLTLTSVVFECGVEVWKCLGKYNLTLTSVVFESVFGTKKVMCT